MVLYRYYTIDNGYYFLISKLYIHMYLKYNTYVYTNVVFNLPSLFLTIFHFVVQIKSSMLSLSFAQCIHIHVSHLLVKDPLHL